MSTFTQKLDPAANKLEYPCVDCGNEKSAVVVSIVRREGRCTLCIDDRLQKVLQIFRDRKATERVVP